MLVLILLLIGANVVVSMQGFKSPDFLDRYVFDVERIRLYRQYYRLVSGGFVHSNWLHLIFNMLGLFFFASMAAQAFGPFLLLPLYFISLVGGHLFAWWVNRLSGNYRALGASGAVMGIIFGSIAVYPDSTILLFFFPMPAWVFGIMYILFSIYGIQAQRGMGVGHEAHLGGALIGMVFGMLIHPDLVKQHPWVLLAMVGPTVIYIYLLATRPEMLLIPGYWGKEFRKTKEKLNTENRFFSDQEELDFLLDKVHRKGINNLTAKEKKRLDDLASRTRS